MIAPRTRRTVGLAAVVGLALAVPFSTANAAVPAQTLAPLHAPGTASVEPGQYIVVLSGTSTDASVASVAAVATKAGATINHTYSAALKGFSATSVSPAALAAIRSAAGVAYVEPNARASLDVLPASAGADKTQKNATWGIDRVDQRDLPLDHKYTYNQDGKGVTAYVIDTGINFPHVDFEGRATSGPDYVDDDDDSTDCYGHGTHVSGIIGGKTYGVAKKISLVGLRTVDCSGSGVVDDTVAAVDWVTAHAKGPSLINMSLHFGPVQALDDAVAGATKAGIVNVVAAGNFSEDACTESPARAKPAMTVAATQIDDAQASFSNYGKCVDVYAPGVDITSDWIGSDHATNTISGTSMSSPSALGVAALYFAQHTSASPKQVIKGVVKQATKGKITSIGPNSPNKLVYSLLK